MKIRGKEEIEHKLKSIIQKFSLITMEKVKSLSDYIII